MDLHLKNSLVVSFCISTYNRSEKVLKLINEILNYEGDDIEVIVSDNCSTDDTIEKLNKIKDKRFRFVENEKNIGAIPNYVKALAEGRGKYLLFCTDKDSLLTSGISDVFNFFRQNPDIIAGYFALDVVTEIGTNIFKKGVEGLMSIGYLSRHPTGYFFRNEDLKSQMLLKDYSDVDKVGPFPLEFMISDLCMNGETAIVNIPLFYTETLEDVKNIKSYSYSGTKNNLYFYPVQRYNMFERYVEHVKSLNLSFEDQRSVVRCLYKNCLASVTIGFKLMVQNKIVCDHYSIKYQKVSLVTYVINDFNFSKEFISNTKFSTTLTRILISLETHYKYVFSKGKI